MKMNCICITAVALATACAPIRVETSKPIQIDVNMKVELFQKDAHAGENGATESISTPVGASRRNRMGEIQLLKDCRVVGENREGYLKILTLPPVWLPKEEYVQKIVKSENNDRQLIYALESRKTGKPLESVEQKYAADLRKTAFVGEWIQGTDGKWIQK